eukprot:TRINITY_DN4093_c0_g2_i1.p1 TRINITY_DN4093_c0_g2~~TRINITY_DN4093_c0_g2_i1.p1  ORF type:complete len:465 (+),score=134.25 TRINITY_DN4093_c0_g2_i1:86-1480(+)
MVHYSEAEVSGFLDVEGQDPIDGDVRRPWRLRHALAAMAGVAAVGTCGAVLMQQSMAPAEVPQPTLTARSLLESPAIHDVAAENVMNIKSRIPQSQKTREEVRHLVELTFKDMVKKMRDGAPEMYSRLDNIELTQEHHDGVVHMMRYLKDPRVMQLGVDTAKAIRDAKSQDEDVLKKHIVDKLRERADTVRDIWMEMPPSVQDFATSRPGDGFKSVLQPGKLKRLQTVGGKWYDQFTTSAATATPDTAAPVSEKTVSQRRLFWNTQPQAYHAGAAGYAFPAQGQQGQMTGLPQFASPFVQQGHSWVQHGISHQYKVAEEVLSIIGTAIGEADTMVRMINPLEKVMPGGHDLKIPPWVTTALGGADFMFQCADCEMDAAADTNAEEALGCPAMSASAGFDMMREPFTLMGILGDNNPGNGAQGNHAGHASTAGAVSKGAGGQEMKKEACGHFPMCMLFNNCHTKC